MKKLFLLSTVMVFSVGLFAQQKKHVEFTQTVYDFGKIAEGFNGNGLAKCIFVFTNTSAAPIFIESARASCGCTTPRVDSSKPIAPGENGEIPVSYNTNGRPGGFNKQITVNFKSAAGESFTERLYIKGEVVAKGSAQYQEILVKSEQKQENKKVEAKKENDKKKKKAKKEKKNKKKDKK